MFFLDAVGRQHSLPVGWTDAAGPDVFVTVAAGRCLFKVADLLSLAHNPRLLGSEASRAAYVLGAILIPCTVSARQTRVL